MDQRHPRAGRTHGAAHRTPRHLAKMDEGGELDMEDCDLSELAKRAIAEAHHGKALCTTNGVDTITFGIVLRP